MTEPSSPCPTAVMWDERFLSYDFGPDHPFTEKSRALAVHLLLEAGFFAGPPSGGPGILRATVPPATEEELELFHTRSYLRQIHAAGRQSPPPLLDGGDTPAFPGCFEASAHIVGGTLSALRTVLEGTVRHACNPAGGLHHAAADRASGFCIFNDVGVAIREALRHAPRIRRVAYVDIDAHHGDGVMYAFYDDPRVLCIDFHQDGRTLFPGTGRISETGGPSAPQSKVNVPLPPGAGDETFQPLFSTLVPPLLRDFRPDLIVLQNGLDGHGGDPLAQLQYTPSSYELAVRILHDLAHELCDGRLLQTGGGGYDPRNVSRGLARSIARLAGWPLPRPPMSELPHLWRQEYHRILGQEAPTLWDELPAPGLSPGDPKGWERILMELSRALGRGPFQDTGSRSSPARTR
jgi:acetoin utilization protein AcuC